MSGTLNLMPDSLVAGESLSVTVTVAGYSPDDGWSLAYRFAAQPTGITAAGADNGAGGWTVSLTSAQTLTMLSGSMRYDALVTKGDESVAVDKGAIVVSSSPLLASKWATVLDSVDAAIATWGTSDQRSITIEGMSIYYRQIEELFKLRTFCLRMIARESGNKQSAIVRTRFAVT